MRLRKLGLIALISITKIASAQEADEDSKFLSRCEGAYIFLAHLAQMQNNEGLTKNLLYRASRTTTAYLFLNERGGKVPGELLNKIAAPRRAEKKSFDQNPNLAINLASRCDDETGPLIKKAQALNKTWDGKQFHEWQASVFEASLKILAIKH